MSGVLYLTDRVNHRPSPAPEGGPKPEPGSPVLDPDTLKVLVQVPPGLGWDRDTAVAFTSGVTVEPGARGGVG